MKENTFFDELKSPSYVKHMGSFPVFRNPALRDFKNCLKSSTQPELRFIADPDNEALYVFPTDILHGTVAEAVYEEKPDYVIFGACRKSNTDVLFVAGIGTEWGKKATRSKRYRDFCSRDWNWLKKYFSSVDFS